MVAVDQPEVAEAMQFIRENACRPLHADDVAQHLAVSRSTLERYLQAAVGHSATSSILQSRLTTVKDLLADTDLQLAAIASQTGFASIQHLANLFRHRVGVTRGRYRREMRYGGSGS